MNDNSLIAPCGMNCALCHSFQNTKMPCPGCRSKTDKVRKSCRNCIILSCEKKDQYCFECKDFPCKRLKTLDERYRAMYGMSMLDNLAFIKEKGEDDFLTNQKLKYSCPICGNLKTVHYDYCIFCKQTMKSPFST